MTIATPRVFRRRPVRGGRAGSGNAVRQNVCPPPPPPPRGRLSAAALAALAALAPAGALAQTSPPACAPTPTVSAAADANSYYTTTLVCGARSGKTAGQADYRQVQWDQTAKTGTPTNNAASNHVQLTVKNGVELAADGIQDLRALGGYDGAVWLRGRDTTVTVENGATINLDRRPAYWRSSDTNRPSDGTEAYYSTWREALNNHAGVMAWSNDGDITITHNGTINLNVDTAGSYAHQVAAGAGIWAFARDTKAPWHHGAEENNVLVQLGATGVIRNIAGSDGGGGIYVRQQTEDGDITIDLAAGSLIDTTAEGGMGIDARIKTRSFYPSKDPDGDLIVRAGGTIRTAVRRRPITSTIQGVGISAWHVGTGRVRIVSSGALKTVQALAIEARSDSPADTQTDNVSTTAIEGHLVDITGGLVETRGNTAINVRTWSDDADFSVRVASGATVRAQALTEADYENGAITQEQLEDAGNNYVFPIYTFGWRYVEMEGTDENGMPATVTRLEPIVGAIAMTRWAAPATGVRDRVIVEGKVETIGADEKDPAIWLERGGLVTVGSDGAVEASSGLAIAGGCNPDDSIPIDPRGVYKPICTEARTPALEVDVAGRVVGDIRIFEAGSLTVTTQAGGRVEGDILSAGAAPLTANVMAGGVVTGTIRNPQTPFAVAGSIGRLLYSGDDPITVTVAGGGKLTGVEGKAIESASAAAALTVAVQANGRVEGDILAGRALSATVMAGGAVTGTIRNPQTPFTVANRVSIGRLLYSGDDPITVTVAGGGKLTGVEGKAIESASATAALTVAVQANGRVEGDILSGGALSATVMAGGAVTGTIRNPQTPFTVSGSVGRLLYTRSGTVTVARGGAITGVEIDGATEAIRGETGNLDVTVAAGGAVTGNIEGRGAGDLKAAVSGEVTGNIAERGAGDLDVTVSGTVTGGIRGEGAGAHTVAVAAAGAVAGTVHLPTGAVTISGRVGSVRYDNGGAVTVNGAITGVETAGATEAIRGDAGNLDVTVAADGDVTGSIEERGAGNLKAAVSGAVTGDIAERGAGDLDVTVSGTVAGGVVGAGAGAHKVAVESAGAVTGTVRLPANAETTIAGKVGRVHYDNGGAVTVNANGEITGIEIEGTREAVRSDAGDLAVAVHGTVTGNIEARGDGDLTVMVSESGTITGEIFGRGGGTHTIEIADKARVLGTVHNPKRGTTISGQVGRVLFDNGGALAVAATGRIAGVDGEAIRSAAGDLTVTVAGKATGNVESRGGALAATVTGTVEGDILGLGAGEHTVAVRGGGLIAGTVRLAASEVDVDHGAAGRVLLDKGGSVKVGARGRIAGLEIEGAREAIRADAGDLTVTIASGGAAMGRIEGRGAGGMDVDVSGAVTGAIRGAGAGRHEVTVASGGSVTGDIIDLEAGDLVASVAGRVTGSIEERGAGDLAATVSGAVSGDIRGAGAGRHEVTVASEGAVAGAIRGVGAGSHTATVAGRVGRVHYDNGGSVTVAATGSISGMETPGGGREAIRSAAGDLTVDVAAMATVTGDIRGEGDGDLDVDVSGTVEGGIFGLGGGEHDVHVKSGGSVEGLIHLAASTVTVDGAAASVRFDRGGRVEVGAEGRITGLDGRAVYSAADDLTVTVNGVVMGSVSDTGPGDLAVTVANALTGDVIGGGGGAHRLTVLPGGVFKGNVEGVELVRVAGRAEGTLNVPAGNDVTVPAGGELVGAADDRGLRVAVLAETGALSMTVEGRVEGDVEARDRGAASTVTVGAGGVIDGKVALAGAGSGVTVDGAVDCLDLARGAVTIGENGRIVDCIAGEAVVTVKAAADESDEDIAARIGESIGEGVEVRLQRAGEDEAVLEIDADGRPIFDRGPAPRHRVYEALPSVLLALNALPAYGDRFASAGAPRGAFARLDAGGGERHPASSTAASRHDYRRFGFEAGFEGAAGERGVFAISVHHVRGRADVETDGGRVEVAGTGARISGAWLPAEDFYVSGQAAATLYEADLDSTVDGALARDLSGRGYAVGVEAGRRLELGRVALTPRAGADWSMVEMSSFTDSANERVSLDAGRRITARAGVRAESGALPGGAGGVFATLDVERELSGAMRATAADEALSARPESTWARLGLGAAHEWADGRIALRAAADYAAARNGNRDFAGSATLTVRF